MTGRLDAALSAAGRGWPVFPLRPGQKRPRPELVAWEDQSTVDPARIERWWRRHPADNIAIATGPAGLIVVDLDLPKPGEPSPEDGARPGYGLALLTTLAEQHHQPLPATWTVLTASQGRHHYYRAPKAGGPWRNTTGRIGRKIDTRAGGGYVVAAGSTVNGRTYTVIDDHPPADLPRWLEALLTPPPATASSAPILTPNSGGYAASALAGEVQRVLDAPHGQRNAALNRAAWNLARHIANGILDRLAVEHALCSAGETAGGQTPAGVAATVRSAINARLRGGRPS